MRSAWRDPRALLEYLDLDPERFALDSDSRFRFLVTRAFAGRMRAGDPHDPLLGQVLPAADEARSVPGFGPDPVGDAASRVQPGVLHKYHGRALLVATGACPIHCRYCFRREFDYAGEMLSSQRLAAAADYIRQTAEIREIILSGGDPLMLDNERLARVTAALRGIGHLRRLRIHSRVPVTLPDRVDDGLLGWIDSLPWQIVVVVHANHAREFDDAVAGALARLRGRGVTVFNQAVLLAGINDDADALAGLMETGFAAGAIPYYLHQLDRVSGSAHFAVDDQRARGLLESLRRVLPGYLVPRLVRERAGAPYKLPIL